MCYVVVAYLHALPPGGSSKGPQGPQGAEGTEGREVRVALHRQADHRHLQYTYSIRGLTFNI